MSSLSVFRRVLPVCALLALTGALAPAAAIELVRLGTYVSGVGDGGAGIVAHDRATQRLFVTNRARMRVDVLDITQPGQLELVGFLPLDGLGSELTSVDAYEGLVAAAVTRNADLDGDGEPEPVAGLLVFFDARELERLGTFTVGVFPKMVTFTPEGARVLVANEGPPNERYSHDPEGSISVVDVRNGVARAVVRRVGFEAYNGREAMLRRAGVLIYGAQGKASAAQDLEPEYIAVAPDSKTAWVTLQENNALAVLDVERARIEAVVPFGWRQEPLAGPLFGLYQPSAIAAFAAEGRTYLITANAGEVRDYKGFSEQVRVADLRGLDLDDDGLPDPWGSWLGGLEVSAAHGDPDADGLYEALFRPGTGSFSIWSLALGRVFDSGGELSRYTEVAGSARPRPKGLVAGVIEGRPYAFIGLENKGGVVVYDLTQPRTPQFLQYRNERNFEVSMRLEDGRLNPAAGDVGPEGLEFIPAADSPNGQPLLAVANRVSGTTTLYRIGRTQEADLARAAVRRGAEAAQN